MNTIYDYQDKDSLICILIERARFHGWNCTWAIFKQTQNIKFDIFGQATLFIPLLFMLIQSKEDSMIYPCPAMYEVEEPDVPIDEYNKERFGEREDNSEFPLENSYHI